MSYILLGSLHTVRLYFVYIKPCHMVLSMYNRLHLHSYSVVQYKLIPAAVRSKTKVCGRSTAGITGSDTADGTDVFSCVNSVGSVLCDVLITRAEKSYRVYVCVIVRDLETSTTRRPGPESGCCDKEEDQHVTYLYT